MKNFKQIDVKQAREFIQEHSYQLIDIRDPESFQAGHEDGAQNILITELQAFADKCDKSVPIFVYCYRGNSSQKVAQYLVEQEFDCVYSIVGGYEAISSATIPA